MAYGKSCETLILRNSNPWINRPDVPISPQQAGITYPDPSYEIRRDRSMPFYDFVYVFEYVTKGKGYIECNGRKYTVRAGDFYFLNRRIEPHYYPDPADPYEKIWANIGGTFLNMMTEAYHINMPVLVCRGLDEKGINMSVSDSAKELICQKGYSKTYGARPMRRYIERNIEDKIAQLYIAGSLPEGSRVSVTADSDEINVSVD